SNIIQRWDLRTFEREATAPLALKGTVKALCMGSASHGPLLVGGADGPTPLGGVAFLDVQTFKPLEFTNQHQLGFGDGVHLRASADGKVFTLWRQHGGRGTIMPMGKEVKGFGDGSSGYAIPSADGQGIFANLHPPNSAILFTAEFKPLPSPPRVENHFLYPAIQGYYYLSVAMGIAESNTAVHLVGDVRPIATLPKVEVGWGPSAEEWHNHAFPLDRRIYFLPDAHLIVTLPRTNDRLVLHRFDVEEALEKSSVDYLFVTSRPIL